MIRLPPRSGLTSDRDAARMPWRVVTPQGRILAGAPSEAAAKKTAETLNEKRAEPVRVEKRGSR